MNILLGKYYHDSSFGLTLTDQIWNLQYLALNCGGAIEASSDIMTTEQVTVTTGGVITVTKTPQEFTSTSGTIGWYKLSTEDDNAYRKITFIDSKATVSDLQAGTIVCVKYVITSSSARKFTVNADYIPSTVHAIMTIGLFKAGTTKETLSTSSRIGDVIVDVPNFQLEGAQDLGLTSSGIGKVALSGSALATFSGNSGCSDHGYYAVITENIYGADEFDNVSRIVIGDSNIELSVGETQTINVYAMYNDGTQPKLLDNRKLTFTSGTTSVATVSQYGGVVNARAVGSSNIEVVVTDSKYSNLNASAVVTVE